jgi:hypothetical protein
LTFRPPIEALEKVAGQGRLSVVFNALVDRLGR